MKFNELNLSEFMLDALSGQEFSEATEIQSKCIPEILAKKDVIGKSQTGSGKTFAYGIPAIEMIDRNLNAVQVLIICPTRELACQVCDELRKITALTDCIKTVPIYGGSNMDRQIASLKKSAKIVVGTPGRLMDHLKRKTLKLNNLKMVVLDEADEMLDMGFIGDIETILSSCNSNHQTVMFSATMSKQILGLTNKFMKDEEFIEIGSTFQLVNTIEQNFVYHDKKDALIKIIEKYNPYIGIIFCNTKRMTDEVTKLLMSNKIKALSLHGDMRQSARKKTLADFKSGKIQVLVGTDVAARGLDVKNVDIVVNFDLPYDVEYYIHRIGRTGRAGCKGLAISLINTPNQRKQLAFIEKEIKQDIEQLLLDGDKLVFGDKSTLSLAREKKSKGKNSFSKNSFTKKRSNRTKKNFKNNVDYKNKENEIDNFKSSDSTSEQKNNENRKTFAKQNKINTKKFNSFDKTRKEKIKDSFSGPRNMHFGTHAFDNDKKLKGKVKLGKDIPVDYFDINDSADTPRKKHGNNFGPRENHLTKNIYSKHVDSNSSRCKSWTEKNSSNKTKNTNHKTTFKFKKNKIIKNFK